MFYVCSALTSVHLGKNITNSFDGQRAFFDCYSFADITVDADNPAYSSLDGVLYDKNRTTLIQCPFAKAGNYTIPSSVATISPSAFHNCYKLAGVTIPDSVTTIGDKAFQGAGLASIVVPNCSMGSSVFDTCSLLANATINVGTIGDYAFINCVALANVTMADTVTNIGTSAFAGCRSLTTYPRIS